MRVGGISGYSGMNSLYGIYNQSSSNYSISSVHGNPKSLQPIDKVSQDSEASKALAIVKKTEDVQDIADIQSKQTMTVTKDYDQVMQQMMQGVDPQRFSMNVQDVSDVQDASNVQDVSNVQDASNVQTFKVQESDANGSVENGSSNHSQYAGFEAFQVDARSQMIQASLQSAGTIQSDLQSSEQNSDNSMNTFQMQRAMDAYNMLSAV